MNWIQPNHQQPVGVYKNQRSCADTRYNAGDSANQSAAAKLHLGHRARFLQEGRY